MWMEREGGNGERMKKCRESFSLHFLILSPFPLHFVILSPFPRSPAPRLQRVAQPWATQWPGSSLQKCFCFQSYVCFWGAGGIIRLSPIKSLFGRYKSDEVLWQYKHWKGNWGLFSFHFLFSSFHNEGRTIFNEAKTETANIWLNVIVKLPAILFDPWSLLLEG